MEDDSLNDLFIALSNSEDEIRSQAEAFVLNMIEEKNIDFIDKILHELVHINPSLNQIWYSFVIIKKCKSFYEDYQKIIDTSLRYFEHENEQIRINSVLTFCIYSIKAFETRNDQTSIQLLLSNIKPTSNFFTIESTIRSISTIIKKTPNNIDLSILIDYLFDFFNQSETIENDTVLILAINDIIPLISETYIIEGEFIQKLMFLVKNVIELKSIVYMILRTLADYFYSTRFLSEVMDQIVEISCHDLSEINDTETIMRIITFWNEIARRECEVTENELNFLYINSYGETLTPYLVDVLSKQYNDYDSESVESKTDWKPLQASRETIKLFCLNSFNLISPILFQFLNESEDTEMIFFVLSIIVKTMPKTEEMKSQIPTFLKSVFSELTSSNVRVRFSALYALNSIASLDFLQPQEFEPFFEIFSEECTDIEQNARKSFKIFAKICSKMPIEKESEFIIQILQSIEQIPTQYISFFLDYIAKYNFNEIGSNDTETVYNLITFFSTFLENAMNEYKDYSITNSTISILQKFFMCLIPGLNLNQIFNDILNLLMKAFSEFTISTIPLTISYLFLSDENSSLSHVLSIVQFFISLINESQSLTVNLLKSTLSALLLVIYMDIKNEKMINDVYCCICNLMGKIKKDDEIDDNDDDDENLFLINMIFEFFDVILLLREIDDEILQNLFKLIKKFFSLPETEMHEMIVKNSSLYDQILEFVINLILHYPESINSEYLTVIEGLCNSINSLNYKTEEIDDKYKQIQSLLAQMNSEE